MVSGEGLMKVWMVLILTGQSNDATVFTLVFKMQVPPSRFMT